MINVGLGSTRTRSHPHLGVRAVLPLLSTSPAHIRPARPWDAEAIARIHNQGIAERVATFETRTQRPDEVAETIAGGALLLVAEEGGEVVAWATVGAYDDAHPYYAGIGEATLYVDRGSRRAGIGATLLDTLAAEAERRGYHKLIGKIFSSNEPSLALVRSCGWREVGLHRRHGLLDGEWRDVVVVERLLGEESG
jgi:L-amino acid N-acyltransferase YncA